MSNYRDAADETDLSQDNTENDLSPGNTVVDEELTDVDEESTEQADQRGSSQDSAICVDEAPGSSHELTINVDNDEELAELKAKLVIDLCAMDDQLVELVGENEACSPMEVQAQADSTRARGEPTTPVDVEVVAWASERVEEQADNTRASGEPTTPVDVEAVVWASERVEACELDVNNSDHELAVLKAKLAELLGGPTLASVPRQMVVPTRTAEQVAVPATQVAACGMDGNEGSDEAANAVHALLRVGRLAAMAGWQPNDGQVCVIEAFFSRAGVTKEMVVLGGPGTGKSKTLKALARGVDAMKKKAVVLSEYNTQVTKLGGEMRHEMGRLAPRPRTRAGLYQMENVGKPRAADMVEAMSETSIAKLVQAEAKFEDEFALGAPGRIDACHATDLIVREGRPLSYVKFGDPFQGDPIVDVRDLDTIPGSAIAPRDSLAMDGKWFQSPGVEVYTLTEAERFKGEELLQGCLYELSGGPCAVGTCCEQVRVIASQKQYRSDLYVHLGVGSNGQVMTKDNAKQLQRAALRGATVANGQMVHWRDEAAIEKYEKEELKVIRSTGFEDAVYVIGERGLIAVPERDPEATTAQLKHGKRPVTHMTGATVRGFDFDESGQLVRLYVELDNHRPGEPWIQVPRTKVRKYCHSTTRYVEAEVFALKPFWTRFIRLYQVLNRVARLLDRA